VLKIFVLLLFSIKLSNIVIIERKKTEDLRNVSGVLKKLSLVANKSRVSKKLNSVKICFTGVSLFPKTEPKTSIIENKNK
jgi:hypothetical protein